MRNYDLSVVIPALREEFISNTVADIIKNKRGNTEVIVVLDGEWAHPGIMDHPDVTVIKLSKNVGQRAATNIGVKASKAKYVAKTDAHCAFDEGFDVKLMDALQGHDDWTIVPVMRNMHIFNWRCVDCGDETYQGPVPEGCKNCDVNTPDRFEKVIKWIPKTSPNSSAYKFTPNKLQFKYFGSLKNKQLKSGESVAETMSLQGSFFMLTREKYWELKICDESWGGWGQQGTEVALKTWLSGGRVVCLLDTWYAHMFRTQSGFAFPWNGGPVSQGTQQHQARRISQDLFFNNKWDKQVRPLSWVVERFWNELQQEPDSPDDPRWTIKDLNRLKQADSRVNNPSKGIIFYTTNRLPLKIARAVQGQLRSIGLPITSSSQKTMHDMGKNVVTHDKPSYLTMFKQILAALEASDADIVYFCEHDNLYHPSHFDFTPLTRDKFYYDLNWWKIRKDGLAVHWDAVQVSGLVCYRELAIKFYKERIATYDENNFDRKFEPTIGGQYETWRAEFPSIDIRHEHNLTYNKWKLEHFRKKETAVNFEESTIDQIPGWDNLSILLE